MRSFQTKQSVNKTNVSDGLFKQVTQQNLPQIRKQAVRNTNVIAPGPSRNCPKHVSHQSPREKVGSNDMVHNYYLEKAKKSAQLQKAKEVNGKPSMIDPARLPNTANGCKPKPRNWQASMSSRVSNKDVHLGEHRKQKPFLKFNDLQCPTCKKCLYSANHDECVLEYLSRLNPRASAQIKDAKSHNTTKRYVPVEKTSESKKPERLIPKGHRFSHKKTPLSDDNKVVRLGINPMIQPEPEDLPKDNPKLEIAVLRVILFSIHNDEWKSFQCHHQTALRSNGGNGNLNPIHMLNLRRHTIMKAQDLKTKTSANSDLKLSR
ncbi:hypothetical protein Tco_1003767 [Tanacetum coccineum]|uniref:Uncharacterized protein n=1 Tax=Tanacetum coccineum TaxID=301880 RepID=A0ABQ5FAZ7_9ASTR